MATTFFGSLRDELLALLAPLATAATPGGLAAMLQSFGHGDALAGQTSLQQAIQQAAGLIETLRHLDDASLGDWNGLSRLLQAAGATFDAVHGIERAIGDPALAAEAEGLGARIAGRLVALHLRAAHPRLHRIATLLTLIDPAETATPGPLVIDRGRIVRMPIRDDNFRFDRLDDLVHQPFPMLRDAYFPNGLANIEDAYAGADRLLPLLAMAASALGLRWRRDLLSFDPPPPADDDQSFGDHFGEAPVDDDTTTDSDPLAGKRRRLPRGTALLAGSNGAQRLGISASVSSAAHEGGIAGVIFSLEGDVNWSETIGRWQLAFSSDATIPAFVIGPHGVAPAPTDTALTAATAHLSVTPVADGSPAWLVGSPTGTRLEIDKAHISADLTLSPAHSVIALTAASDKAAIVLAAGDGDGFLASLLPAGGLRTEFVLGLTLSSDQGLVISGSAGLQATIPVGRSLAGITLSSLHLGLSADGGGLSGQVTASLAAGIGPVHVAIDGIGLATTLRFPTGGGNLGVADFALGFQPPAGMGLSLDADGILTGGGALFHDAAQGLYAGAVRVSIHDRITLNGFGLITTKLPDGSRGYSLFVMITAEGFQPIQLGMGFNLQKIGGLIAVHRTFDQDTLRQGLKTDALATLLGARDPVTNAAAIVQAVSTVFPVRQGSYLIGLLARICWPTPTLVQMDLALVLEVGAQRRLLVLGRISSLLPSRDNDLVRINLDAMGVLDFDQETLSIDAVLVDSRLAHKFPLSGAMALRARLGGGSGSAFVMAIGGLNPRFAPPQGLPDLPRVSIALSSGANPRLTCEAYFAITANTVQFGARAQLHAEAYGFSVDGDIGFDVLIQISPLKFVADFHASLQLKHGSDNLFKVSVDGSLAGPRPLQISGKASFEIFWCDFSISFNKTLVNGPPPPAAPPIDVGQLVMQALSAPASWSNETPPGSHGVALRADTAPGALVLDPSGRLVVRQLVAPLNTGRDIDVYDGVPVAGARRFHVAASLSGKIQPAVTVQDQFAPAQYFAMTDDEKLAAPSYETLDAGLVFGDAISFDPNEIAPAPLTYETLIVDDLAPPPAPSGPRYAIGLQLLQSLSQTGAAARASTRRSGRFRFVNDAAQPGAVMKPQSWVVTPLADGPPAGADPLVRSWTELRGTLAKLNLGQARWQLAPSHELEANRP